MWTHNLVILFWDYTGSIPKPKKAAQSDHIIPEDDICVEKTFSMCPFCRKREFVDCEALGKHVKKCHAAIREPAPTRSKWAPKRSKQGGEIRKAEVKRVGERMKIGKKPEKKMSKKEETGMILYSLRVRAEKEKHVLIGRVVDDKGDNHRERMQEADWGLSWTDVDDEFLYLVGRNRASQFGGHTWWRSPWNWSLQVRVDDRTWKVKKNYSDPSSDESIKKATEEVWEPEVVGV